MNLKRIFSNITLCTFLLSVSIAGNTCFDAAAQEQIVVDPLFEYPEAPSDLATLTERADWLLTNFWEKMDFKSKKTVDQNALNHAFKVYCATMPYAQKSVVDKSTQDILKKLQKNTPLMMQFTKAAEEALYSPRAQAWIDPVYIEYLKAFVANKKIQDIRKTRYRRQLKLLEASLIGEKAPEFTFKTVEGKENKYFPMSTPTVIEFGNPDCDDCRHSMLKMDSNAAFSGLVDKGLINVLFIIPDADENWKDNKISFPSKWAVGASDDVAEIYDIRLSPTFYVIDGNGKIVEKNISVDRAMRSAMDLSSEKQK